MAHLGFVKIGNTFYAGLQIDEEASGLDQPHQPDATPTWRAYGPSGFVIGGNAAPRHSITDLLTATVANPVVVTTNTSHLFANDTPITISGVTGTGNGDFNNPQYTLVANATATTFELAGVDGTAHSGIDVASTGIATVTGLYVAVIVASTGNGFAEGNTYSIVWDYAIDGNSETQHDSFGVT